MQQFELADVQIWLNVLRVIINAALVVYLFKEIFEGKFK